MITGNNFYLNEFNTLIEVINNINDSELQVCFIVDKDTNLIGSITDGDIRRGLINGMSMENLASEIMQKNPVYITNDKSNEYAQQLMLSRKINQLPVVNDSGKLIGLFIKDDISTTTQSENYILIMAGGFGKRMMPLTENLPKPMLQVRGKPILEHIILNAKSQGFKNFLISVHYLSELITEYFGDGSKFDVSIEYLQENEPLGTAGCLSLIDFKVKTPLIITNGDILTDISYRHLLDFHNINNSDATMAIKKYELQNPYGVVNTDGINIESFEEKPIQISYVNTGIYAINPTTIKVLKPHTFCNMPDFFMNLKKEEYKIIAYPIHETWADLGRPNDLSDANKIKKMQ